MFPFSREKSFPFLTDLEKNILRRISVGRRLLQLADTFEPGLTAARYRFNLFYKILELSLIYKQNIPQSLGPSV